MSNNIIEDEEHQTYEDEFLFTVDDPVNFPSTISPSSLEVDNTSPSTHHFLSVKTSFGSADEDYVKFPNNLTSQEVFDEGINVRLYNKTSDNNASLILFKLKQLLQSETERGVEEREGAELGERQTRIVYINNKRVELESDSEQ